MHTYKKLFASLLASTSTLLISPSLLAAPVVLELDYEIPVQKNQVAFVPFAGDSVLSPIVLNDLSKTELKITSQNLPQQPHNSSELAGTLPVWQSMGIPYLVVGNTRSNRGKIVTNYEVIDVKSGRVIEGKQSLTADNNKDSMRYAGHVIADKVYELITGVPGDFSGRIAYIEEVGTGKGKVSRLKVMDADGENAKTITEVTGSIFSPTWSPDGNRMAEWAAQLDESVTKEHEQVEQDKKEQRIEEQKKLGDFRSKQNTQPRITRPTENDRNIEINTGSAGKTFSLSDGQSTISGDIATSSPTKGSSQSASSGNRGASNSEIIRLIKRNYHPPTAARGSTQSATLTITVNASGNIVNVSASGPDSAVNDAAKQAVLNTGKLPIDTDDPKYPTFTIQFKGSN